MTETTMEYRSVSLAADGAIDTEARTVSLGVTSEEPVYRAAYGMGEVLDHSEASVDMEFISSGRAPLLLDHDPTQPVAVIEEFKLDPVARQTRAVARFGRSELSKTIFDDLVDGIRSNVSVGYLVQTASRDDTGNEPVMRVSRWKPLEASIVAIPADQSQLVGVGRSDETAEEIESESETKSEAQPQERIKVEENKPQEPPVDLDAVRRQTADDIAKAENERRSEIDALGSKYQERDLAHQAIMDGQSIEEFRGALLEATRSGPVAISKDTDDVGLTSKETQHFSLTRWIAAEADPSSRRRREAAAFEYEAIEAANRANPYQQEGNSLPAEVFRTWNVRDINTSDDSGGVGEDFLPGDFIQALRNRTAVMQAGATVLTGLNNSVKIPKQSGTSTAAWVSSEGGNTSESELTLTSLDLTPKIAGLYTEITGSMIAQASGAGAIGIENLVRNDILASTSLLIDLAATAGSGSSGQPTGLDNTTGVNTVTLTTISTLSWAEAITMESNCLIDNALFGANAGYILNAYAVGLTKVKVKESGQASYVMEDDRINGHPVYVSNNVTTGSIYFGTDFSELLLAFWGSGPSVLVDPYTSSASGTVRIRVINYADIGVRVPQAFTHASGGS